MIGAIIGDIVGSRFQFDDIGNGAGMRISPVDRVAKSEEVKSLSKRRQK